MVLAPRLAKPDEAYPTMMRLLPPGLLGLVFAALVAAIIASTASKINSIATIFTLDLYAKFRGERTRAEDDSAESAGEEKHLVLVGRMTAVTAIIIAILVGQATGRKLRTGIPVHPGIHRLLHAGNHRHLPARPVLEAGDRGRGDRRRSDLGPAVDDHEIHAADGGVPAGHERLSDAVHQPHGRRVPRFARARGGRLAWRRRSASDIDTIDTRDVRYKTSTGFNTGALGVILILIALYATWW